MTRQDKLGSTNNQSMTLRQYASIHILAGIVADPNIRLDSKDRRSTNAKTAVLTADALLAALVKDNTSTSA